MFFVTVEQPQVGRVVVCRITVLVMNDFVRLKRATEDAFHYETMFIDAAPFRLYENVPAAADVVLNSALPKRRSRTRGKVMATARFLVANE